MVAESSSPAGYSGTPLARKLGLGAGMAVRLLGSPEGYWSLFAADPRDDELTVLDEGSREPADFTHLFARERATLEDGLARARKEMAEDGMVWVSWPKKSSGVDTEVGRAEVMAAGKAVGLVDVKVCAVDETWSGLKFVIPVADRKPA